jgi:cytochrome c peroxidase
MNVPWLLLALAFVCCTLSGRAQATVPLRLKFSSTYEGKEPSFGVVQLTNPAQQRFSISRLEFLLSEFSLRSTTGEWVAKTNWQAYISLNNQRSLCTISDVSTGTFDRVRFHVGLAPELNHAPTTHYPPDHPLNPTLNGMYWGWAGGYVFFAIEGNWETKRKTISGYSFHLGNDPQLMTVEMPVKLSITNTAELSITLNLNTLFSTQFDETNSSTHSRGDDPIAQHLKRKIESAWGVHAATARTTEVNTPAATVHAIGTNVHPYRFTFSSQFPVPDLPHDNPLTEEGVELGRALFNEPLLSLNNLQTCASCHEAGRGFVDGKRFSRGAEGKTGTRNSMPLFNLAWKHSFFWDGRSPTLRDQVLQPIQNPIEMHETLSNAVSKLERASEGRLKNAAKRNYGVLFEHAFGSSAITAERIALALEQFVLAQVSYNSKFDQALDGKTELTEEEKRGFQLFVTEYDPRREQFGADCFHCHGGPLFQSQAFGNNGLDSGPQDLGRYEITRNEGDKGKFAVPSLRNVEITGPYMHDGRFNTLEEVVEHYATGVRRSTTLDPNIAKHPDGGVPLSAEDKKALVAFLKTLTDERFRK